MSNITQTSMLAWFEVKPKLGEKQANVLEALELKYPATDKMLAAYLGWPINCVTPRRNELVKKGKVVEARIDKDITGRKATYWKPARTQELREHE